MLEHNKLIFLCLSWIFNTAPNIASYQIALKWLTYSGVIFSTHYKQLSTRRFKSTCKWRFIMWLICLNKPTFKRRFVILPCASHRALSWVFPSECWTITWSTCASCGILAQCRAPRAAKWCCGDQPTWESFSLLATDNYPHAISHASGASYPR